MAGVIVMGLPGVALAQDYVGTQNAPGSSSDYTNLPATGANVTRMVIIALALGAIGVALMLQTRNVRQQRAN
jgi:hypothetical protein